MQRECDGSSLCLLLPGQGGGGLDGEPYFLCEGIAGFFFDGDGAAVGNLGRYFRRSIDKGSKPFVRCGIPKVLHELRPPLVHVAGATGIAVEGSKELVGVVVRR